HAGYHFAEATRREVVASLGCDGVQWSWLKSPASVPLETELVPGPAVSKACAVAVITAQCGSCAVQLRTISIANYHRFRPGRPSELRHKSVGPLVGGDCPHMYRARVIINFFPFT